LSSQDLLRESPSILPFRERLRDRLPNSGVAGMSPQFLKFREAALSGFE
jgi:hypothetical protein